MNKGITRSPVTVIILSIVTCGIYSFIWLFTVSKEINDFCGEKKVDPVVYFLLGILCFPLIFVGLYKIDLALYDMNTRVGLPANKNFTMWLILCLLGVGTLFASYQIQDQLNKIWERV